MSARGVSLPNPSALGSKQPSFVSGFFCGEVWLTLVRTSRLSNLTGAFRRKEVPGVLLLGVLTWDVTAYEKNSGLWDEKGLVPGPNRCI